MTEADRQEAVRTYVYQLAAIWMASGLLDAYPEMQKVDHAVQQLVRVCHDHQTPDFLKGRVREDIERLVDARLDVAISIVQRRLQRIADNQTDWTGQLVSPLDTRALDAADDLPF